MRYPLVSVLIPTYNRAQFLKETIDSILRQSYPRLEIIVVDDGSIDNTKKIVSAYSRRIVKYFYQKNRGISVTRNRLLALARGELLAFCDSDDVWVSGKLHAQVQYLNENPECQIVFTNYANFLTDSSQMEEEYVSGAFTASTPRWLTSALFRKAIYVRYGGFREEISYAEDTEWIVRLECHGVDLEHKLSGVYYYRRFHGDNYMLQYTRYKNNKVILDNTRKANSFLQADRKMVCQKYVDSTDLISVIIPVLSGEEKQLLYTLKSIQQQSIGFKIEILTMPGNNSAISRNQGLQIAQGNLIVFLNPGDILLKSGLFEMYLALQSNSDLWVLNAVGATMCRREVFNFSGQFAENDLDMSDWRERLENSKRIISGDKQTQCAIWQVQKYYARLRPAADTVLLVEANHHNLEALPGFIKYCLDLNYKVDVIIPRAKLDEYFDSLCFDRRVRVLGVPLQECPEILDVFITELKRYAKVIFTTGYVESLEFPVRDVFANLDILGNKLLVVEHFNLPDPDLLARRRIIALADYLPMAKMVNPHFFGKIKPTSKTPTLVNFVIAYVTKKIDNKHLIDTVQKLHSNGITNFYITMLGKGLSIPIPKEIQAYFDFRGYVSYPELCAQIKKADFLLALLESENPWDQRYLDGCGTCGTYQLAYGFNKPIIIQQDFASLPGFTKDNGIIYKQKDGLVGAMRRAVAMEGKQYSTLQKNLSSLAEQVYQKSLTNMRSMLPVYKKVTKNKKELVSVIIPVFNARQHLAKCLSSVLAQTYTNVEIIVVDDGSTDGSTEIYTQYAIEYPQLKIIRQVNSGAAAARNAGLKLATGKYVHFMDADDSIPADYYAKMLTPNFVETDADMVVGGVYDEGRPDRSFYFNRGDLLQKLSEKLNMVLYKHWGSAWGYLFKAAFLKKYKLKFDEQIKNAAGEDTLFIIYAAYYANKIALAPEAYYIYTLNGSSAMNSPEETSRKIRIKNTQYSTKQVRKFARKHKFEHLFTNINYLKLRE